MNADKQGELLSALMDGETSELELRQLLAAVDDAGCESWSRWHLVQNVLHGHASLAAGDDFSARVQAAINDVIEEAPAAQRPWLRSLSRVAVAASVALAVVTGWQVWQQSGQQSVMTNAMMANSNAALQTPVALDYQVAAPQVRYSYTQPLMARAQPVADTFTISRDDFNRMMERHRQDAAAKSSPYGYLAEFPLAKGH